MPATTKAVVVAAGAAAALAYYLRRKRRAEARREFLATHTKIALLASERGAVVTMSPATSTVTSKDHREGWPTSSETKSRK